MVVELRDLNTKDAKRYLNFLYDLYNEQTCESHKFDNQRLVSEYSVAVLDSLLPKAELTEDNIFLGIYNDGVCVGNIWLAVGEEFGLKTGFLRYLHISEEYRGQGLSKKAIDALEGMCKSSLDIKRLLLNVYGLNEKAHGLYLDAGFKPLKINMEKRL